MKITIDVSDKVLSELQQEVAQTGLCIEGIAAYYLRYGMVVCQERAKEKHELEEAERALYEKAKAKLI